MIVAVAAVQPVSDSRRFSHLANQGNDGDALNLLRSAGIQQAIWACDKLSSDVRDQFLRACTICIDGRRRFALRATKDLAIRAGSFQGVTFGSLIRNCDEARFYIVAALDRAASGASAAAVWFYPKFLPGRQNFCIKGLIDGDPAPYSMNLKAAANLSFEQRSS
jgi:hypothetical protein